MVTASPELQNGGPSEALELSHGRGRRLGYLSGSLRVSTRPEADQGGPRSHMLGVMSGFQELGWQLQPFIVGDRLSPKMTRGSHKLIQEHWWRSLAMDFGRLALRPVCAAKARRELGKPIDWVYERFATFQSLGRRFQKAGAVWILETNGLLYKEAKLDHACLVLSSVARVLELRAYQQCDVLVCISRSLKKLVCDEAFISPHKVLVIPNGVDVQWLDPDKHHPKRLFNGKDLTIGYVGRLTEWQALDLLFRAIYELKADKGLTINLVIAGDGRMKNTWSKMVSDLGLSEQVIFLGQVSSDLIPCYISGVDLGYSGQVPLKSADMYHSPLKIYEYMAMAKPVLASAFDDARSAVHLGKTGFLFEAQNKDDLKRALTDAWNLRQQLPQMGWCARQEVVTHHSWRTRVASLAAGIDSILENHHGNPATL